MYGSITKANAYFLTRLHSEAWEMENATNQTKALYTATRIIDRLNYKGNKRSVYLAVLAAGGWDQLALLDIQVAEAAQELEFPRDTDTTVPVDIETACFEISLALLDGVDPDIELENLGVTNQSYSGVKTSYNRDQQPIEHLLHGIPSAMAWRILKPFLRDGRAVITVRVN
jgi:hypothetical protein